MIPTFPIKVREKDSGKIREYSSVEKMERQLEAIDIENEEYEAWDAEGRPVIMSVQKPHWLRLEVKS
jgi:hypothetical protein